MFGSLIPNVKQDLHLSIENPLATNLLTVLPDRSTLSKRNGSLVSCVSSNNSTATANNSLPDYEFMTGLDAKKCKMCLHLNNFLNYDSILSGIRQNFVFCF